MKKSPAPPLSKNVSFVGGLSFVRVTFLLSLRRLLHKIIGIASVCVVLCFCDNKEPEIVEIFFDFSYFHVFFFFFRLSSVSFFSICSISFVLFHFFGLFLFSFFFFFACSSLTKKSLFYVLISHLLDPEKSSKSSYCKNDDFLCEKSIFVSCCTEGGFRNGFRNGPFEGDIRFFIFSFFRRVKLWMFPPKSVLHGDVASCRHGAG